jgi:hypothetical protein
MPTGDAMKVTRFLLVAVVASATCIACAPPYYSVGVARGPDHITFAQRRPDVQDLDYLVDCAIDAAGKPTRCTTVLLPGESR